MAGAVGVTINCGFTCNCCCCDPCAASSSSSSTVKSAQRELEGVKWDEEDGALPIGDACEDGEADGEAENDDVEAGGGERPAVVPSLPRSFAIFFFLRILSSPSGHKWHRRHVAPFMHPPVL